MKRIHKAMMKDVLKVWSADYRVIAPHAKERGECMFDTFDEETFTLDYTKPSLPPKYALFPQSEVIFRIENSNYLQTVGKDKVLIFGIRPCDLKAQLQSRSFMSKDFIDTYYETRARNTATVVMACQGPQSPTCFCTTMKSGPMADSGYDLQLIDDGDSFLVDIGTVRGQELASHECFKEVDDNEAQNHILSFNNEAVEGIPVREEVREAMMRLKERGAPDEMWERFGSKCIVCGGCSFVCPTCTCFNVYDKVRFEGNGERLRTWDSCLYAGFTKEASGHNPRGKQALRLQRRHEHKLLHYWDRETYGSLCTCVGCGRCSDYCPVHIGTLEVAKAICTGYPDLKLREDILEDVG